MRFGIMLLVLLTTAQFAHARLVKAWSYQELYDAADLVLIAKWDSTKETNEKRTLPDMPDLKVVGLSTTFGVDLVMKGDKGTKKATLHHYRFADPKQFTINGPSLISFEESDEHASFLLFLKREPDGRFAPVSGQTDPALDGSVIKIRGGYAAASPPASSSDALADRDVDAPENKNVLKNVRSGAWCE